jgi:hypothetical protein
MAFLELDRSYVRHFVGYGAIFLQAEPRLENALTAMQSQADGGSRPDSTAENVVKGLIYGVSAVAGVQVIPGGTTQTTAFAQPAQQGLLSLEAKLQTMWDFTFALKADSGEAQIDTARGMMQLRQEGRRLCHAMARMMGMRGVRVDVFSASPIIKDDDPFGYAADKEHWRNSGIG